MTIAFDNSGGTSITVAATSAVVDITAAAVGAWCYAWCAISTGATTQTGIPSATGWTAVQSVQTTAGTSGATYAIFRRLKQSGDTTFTFSWATTAGKGAFSWASWTGVDGTTPDESSAIAINDTVQRSSVPTPSATPTAAGRWAVAFFGQRATASFLKPTSWGPDIALVDRQETDNSTAASAPWLSADIEDSNGTVTVAAHSYTSTSNASNSHDGSAILFLIPAAAVTAGQPAAGQLAVIPRPKPRPRAVVTGPARPPAALAVPAPRLPVIPSPRPRGRAVVIPPLRLLASPAPVTPGRPVLFVPPFPRSRPRPGRVILPRTVPLSPVTPPAAPAGQPPRGDYERHRLRHTRWTLGYLEHPLAAVAGPPGVELAAAWPGVWPLPLAPPPVPEPVPSPAPEPARPARMPVYRRPAKITRRYPETDGWRRR